MPLSLPGPRSLARESRVSALPWNKAVGTWTNERCAIEGTSGPSRGQTASGRGFEVGETPAYIVGSWAVCSLGRRGLVGLFGLYESYVVIVTGLSARSSGSSWPV